MGEGGAEKPRRKGIPAPKPIPGAVAPVEHMRVRREFLAARRGERRGGALFQMEVLDRGLPDAPPRLGMTVTRKVGNAVLRNRIRRRIREAVRTDVARDMKPGHDYVIVARAEVAHAPFAELVSELRARVRREPGQRSRRKEGTGRTKPPRTDAGAARVPVSSTPEA